jgi:hypothetical protein
VSSCRSHHTKGSPARELHTDRQRLPFDEREALRVLRERVEQLTVLPLVARILASSTAAAMPIATPTSATRILSHTTMLRTCHDSAPSASRIPNSCVRHRWEFIRGPSFYVGME